MLLPSIEQCLERVRTRTGHGFTDATATRKMHHEFSAATIEARHVIANGESSPERTASAILAVRAAGRLRYELPMG